MRLQLHDAALQIFDVDHGQCALLTVRSHGDIQRVLIDCGHAVDFRGSPWYPGHHLHQVNSPYIDALVCTNFDEDHMSGFEDLERRSIGIGCILGNPSVSPETIVHLKSKDGMGRGIAAVAGALARRRNSNWTQVMPLIEGVEMSWFWNPYPYFDDENNLSLMLLLNIRGFHFLFPGDMECSGFRNMLRTCPAFANVVPRVNVLVASHHGRHSGICPELFDDYGCNPALVVISDDHKQYSTQETVGYYASKAKGILGFRDDGIRRVLTTRSDGQILFSINGAACIVS